MRKALRWALSAEGAFSRATWRAADNRDCESLLSPRAEQVVLRDLSYGLSD